MENNTAAKTFDIAARLAYFATVNPDTSYVATMSRDGRQIHMAYPQGRTFCGCKQARQLTAAQAAQLTAVTNACRRCWGLA